MTNYNQLFNLGMERLQSCQARREPFTQEIIFWDADAHTYRAALPFQVEELGGDRDIRLDQWMADCPPVGGRDWIEAAMHYAGSAIANETIAELERVSRVRGDQHQELLCQLARGVSSPETLSILVKAGKLPECSPEALQLTCRALCATAALIDRVGEHE